MIGRGSAQRAIGVPRFWRGGLMLRPIAERLRNLPSNRYSRRVALMKLALPTIGVLLLLLVTIWPRVAPLFDRLRFAKIDLREARELRMLNPRYAGTDRNGHPFVVTAAVGRQVPARNDLMALDTVKADIKSHSGATTEVTADSAVYQSQTQFIDMFGNVTLVDEKGTKIVTASARLDVANNAAEGHDPVEGHGPSGDIKAQGFQIVDKGEIVIFTGKTDLWLKSSRSAEAAARQPAALPAPVAQAAAQIEAATSRPPAKPAVRPPAHSPAPQHSARSPARPTAAPKKPS